MPHFSASGAVRRLPGRSALDAACTRAHYINGHHLHMSAGTPAFVVDRLSREMASIIQRPEVREKLFTQGVEPVGSTAAELASVIKKEIVSWTDVIKETNMRIEQ